MCDVIQALNKDHGHKGQISCDHVRPCVICSFDSNNPNGPCYWSKIKVKVKGKQIKFEFKFKS